MPQQGTQTVGRPHERVDGARDALAERVLALGFAVALGVWMVLAVA
jgi:hypothetical protein